VNGEMPKSPLGKSISARLTKGTKLTHGSMKTRRTVRARLLLVTVVLFSIVLWSTYAHVKASEPVQPAAEAHTQSSYENATSSTLSENTNSSISSENMISSALYRLPNKTVTDLFPADSQYIKSHGNPAYYIVVLRDAATGQYVTEGYVFVTTDVAPSWSYGYSGPISTLVSMDPNGVVLSVHVLYQIESLPLGALDEPWLSTLVGKSVLGNYTIGKDIDAVTGATYTSLGVVNGIREAGRTVLKDAQESTPIPEPTSTSELPANETQSQVQLPATTVTSELTTPTDYMQSFFLLGLIGFSIIGVTKKIELLRYVVLLGSLVLVEFMGTRMISISDILNLKNLSMPPLHGNLFWYLLFGSAFFLSLVWGRVYCGWLCPFGAATEFLNKLTSSLPSAILKATRSANGKSSAGENVEKSSTATLSSKVPAFKTKLPDIIREKTFVARYFVLAAVVWSVLIAGNLTLTEVEPFATFFSAQGTFWMWLILFAVLVASVGVNRVFCCYVCPTGAILSLAARFRVKEISRWPECSTCRICERDCSVGGIRRGLVSPADCINCGACERNYESYQNCPHWLISRKNGSVTTKGLEADESSRNACPTEAPSLSRDSPSGV
jgi:NosR/NirI family nitrous oxide reductase transcriptional regulator